MRWPAAVVLCVVVSAVVLLGVFHPAEYRELVCASIGAATAWLFGARRELMSVAADRQSRELAAVRKGKSDGGSD